MLFSTTEVCVVTLNLTSGLISFQGMLLQLWHSSSCGANLVAAANLFKAPTKSVVIGLE